jgi:hypothetical protein
MPQQPMARTAGIPLRGGAVTSVERALLPAGSFSWMQNLRNEHPGLRKRLGQRKLHSVAIGSLPYDKVKTLYQFNKQDAGTRELLAQMDTGEVLKATNGPPTVTTGDFGSVLNSGSSGQISASWGTLGDILVHSNGVDQHALYAGSGSYVSQLIVYKGGGGAPGDVPEEGLDFSNEVRADSTDNVELDALDTLANDQCFFIRTPLRASAFSFVVATANGNAATITVAYRKNDNTWASVTGLSDGTDSGGATLAQDGEISFTSPSDEQPHFQYGDCGWWYRFTVSAALSAEVRISSVTYSGDWQDLENVWNGIADDPFEVWVEGDSQWYNYSAAAVDLDELALGKKILLFCTDPIEGIYVDVGDTPNDTGTSIADIKYSNGSGTFTSVGTVTDASNGFSSNGWVTFPRQSAEAIQYEGAQYYAYVYEITLDSILAADTQVGFMVRPYFSMEDYGKSKCNCVWGGRAVYTFNKWGQYLYVSAQNAPMVLNGADYGILEAGDGRSNRVAAAARFYNEMLVWQVEDGKEGGCTTLFQGYSPATFGKLVLSSRVGIVNAKSVAVVDGVMTSTRTDEEIKTLAFWISRYGVCATDGVTVFVISDAVQNYFDPSKDECIRRGYEDHHWLEYDSRDNVLRIGLVSGSTATVPNVFLVFDLVDKTWGFDTPHQTITCMAEASADTGDVEVLQIGGGDDGFVYQLNYGQSDVTTAIDAYVDIVISAQGFYVTLSEYLVRCVAEEQGTLLLSGFANGLPTRLNGHSVSMTAERAGQDFKRILGKTEAMGDEVVFRVRNNDAGVDLLLLDAGFGVDIWTDR